MKHDTPFEGRDSDGGHPAHVRANRQAWDLASAMYQAYHGRQLIQSGGAAWGVWQIPEDELRVLGDVRGTDILELGCGAAQWSIALARRGGHPVGLDVSGRQLEHARVLMAEAGVDFPLVEASAEAIPLPSAGAGPGAGFDIIFCDWGATTFTDPRVTVPEVSRLLRPGGLFAFNGGTPFFYVCLRPEDEDPGTQLVRDYFGMTLITDDEYVEFMLPYGEWIRLFGRNDLLVEDLIELRPPADAVSTWRDPAMREWSRRWPAEQIWKVRKKENLRG